MNQIKRIEIEAEILMIETEILPDLKEHLEWLTDPNYDPATNDDDELRESDIDYLEDEIFKNERLLVKLKNSLNRYK